MNRLTVMTCFRARLRFGSAPREYGYTLALETPIEHVIEGEDIEGIGWVPKNPPKKVTQYWQGWYKFRSDAQSRADELNKG